MMPESHFFLLLFPQVHGVWQTVFEENTSSSITSKNVAHTSARLPTDHENDLSLPPQRASLPSVFCVLVIPLWLLS